MSNLLTSNATILTAATDAAADQDRTSLQNSCRAGPSGKAWTPRSSPEAAASFCGDEGGDVDNDDVDDSGRPETIDPETQRNLAQQEKKLIFTGSAKMFVSSFFVYAKLCARLQGTFFIHLFVLAVISLKRNVVSNRISFNGRELLFIVICNLMNYLTSHYMDRVTRR